MAEDKSTKAEFGVELVDGMSQPAKNAATALEDLKSSIDADSKALSEMQKAMRNLKQATSADVIKPMADLQKQLDDTKQRLASSQAQYLSAGGAFAKAKAPRLPRPVMPEFRPSAPPPTTEIKSFADQLQSLSKVTADMPGPLSRMAATLGKVAGTMTSAKLATVALAASFVGLVAAAALAAKSLFGEALAAGDAARSELLHFEALTKVRNLLGIAPGKAKDMQDAVDRVSASVSISREKVAGYAATLYQAGLRGKNLDAALEGTSIKASALGDAAGAAFAGFAGSMALAGGEVKRLTDNVKNRFGGIVQKQMASLEVQTLKQKENWASLFRGINVEPFLNAMKRLRDIFSQQTAAGRALKQLFTIFLQPLFDAAESGAVFMRRFFKQMIIGVQELVIAYLTVRNWFRQAFGPSQYKSLTDLFLKLQIGRVVLYTLAAALGVLAFNALVAAAPFLLMAATVYFAFQKLWELYDLWKIIDWGELGQNIIDGLIGGLNAASDAVTKVFEDMADSAINSFKSALGISSPSKVFMRLGTEIPAGAAQGIEQGTPQAQSAAANMVDATQMQLGNDVQRNASQRETAAAGGKLAPASGPVTVTIGELHVHAESSEPKALGLALRREVEAIFEGVGLQLGVQPLGAGT